MNISWNKLLCIEIVLVIAFVCFESYIDRFEVEAIFSLYYSLPILLFVLVFHYVLKHNRLNIITILSYLAIIFLTILSLVQLLMFDVGFGFSTINGIHIFSVLLNVCMMSFSILHLKYQTKHKKSL